MGELLGEASSAPEEKQHQGGLGGNPGAHDDAGEQGHPREPPRLVEDAADGGTGDHACGKQPFMDGHP